MTRLEIWSEFGISLHPVQASGDLGVHLISMDRFGAVVHAHYEFAPSEPLVLDLNA